MNESNQSSNFYNKSFRDTLFENSIEDTVIKILIWVNISMEYNPLPPEN